MWVGVVELEYATRKRIGETMVNLDHITHIEVTENLILTTAGTVIRTNKESIEHLCELIETK